MSELKPCPFCGSEARILKGHHYWAVCPECAARGSAYGERGNAIKAWNTRTPQWVSVEDGLPEEGLCVLGFEPHCLLNRDKGVGVIVADYDITEIRKATGKPWITHWMPLPEPPKEEL